MRYPHPDLAEVLEPTYGVIVYQEQVMRIAQILAGFSLAEADVLRKAVGKKDAELIKKELGGFVDKAVEKGHDRRLDPGPRRPDRGVRPLRLQQVALRRLRPGGLPDGVAEGALPGRVHGRAPQLGARQGRGRGGLHRRLPRAGEVAPGAVPEGPRGAPAARERVEPQVHRGGRGRRADPLRAGRHPRRRRGRGAQHPRRARGGGPLRVALRLPLPRGPAAVQQAGDGGADLRRRAGRLGAGGGRAQLLAALETTFAAAQDVQRERESSQGGLFDA